MVPAELLFERVPGTGIYVKTVDVPPHVRFEYRILENDPLTSLFGGARYGTRMHLLEADPDPLNPKRRVEPDAFGPGRPYVSTWVALPGASPQPYIVDQGNPRGRVTWGRHESERLGCGRRIATYLPPGYDPASEYPLMILMDPSEYFNDGALATTLDNLIADKVIPPLLVLGIEAVVEKGVNRRNDEFTCNPRFLSYVHDELLPDFLARHRITADPQRRVIAGSSFAGLFAAYFAFEHPATVAHVLSQSGSYHWGRKGDPVAFEWLIRRFAFAPKKPIDLYMEVGKLEGEYSWYDPIFPHQIVSHRHFKTILEMKGYTFAYREYDGGHEMLSWRGGIADGLRCAFRDWRDGKGAEGPGRGR